MAAPVEWNALLRRSSAPRIGVHVTDCFACPRKKALIRAGAAIDYARCERRLEGSILHWALADIDPDTAEIPVAGRLWGLDVVGSVDRLRGPVVCDYKNPDGKSKPDGAYPEQVWQLEAYRVILAQMGVATTGWTLHVRYKGEWLEFSHVGPLWTEDELGRFKPHVGQTTAKQLAQWTAEVEKGLAPEEVPMFGREMRLGKGMMCDHCEVAGPCGELAVPMEAF